MTIRNYHERNQWFGTHAERLTVTPSDGAFWVEDDTDTIWAYYAGAWHAVGGGGGGALADHEHAGIAGDGGQFDADHLLSTGANDGDVLTSDGAGAAAWEPLAALTARQTIFTFGGNIILTGAFSLLRIYNKLGATTTISEVFISVDTAPTGADIIVDIHKDGVTIFTNQAHRPVIAAGANTGTTILIDVDDWNDGEYLTAIIDQIGSAVVGANLTVHVLHS